MEATKIIIPFNATTGIEYQGGNIAALLNGNFESPRFATFRQWLTAGRQVQKGQHGIYCRAFGTANEKDEKTGKIKRSSYFRGFVVFNEAQTEEIVPIA